MTSRAYLLAASASLLALFAPLAPAFAQSTETPEATVAPPVDAPAAAVDETAPAAVADPAAPPVVETAPVAPAPESPAETAAPATSEAAAARVPPPPAGKGQVVFFRASKLAGMALTFSIREGDKGVAKVGNGTYAIVAADPGPHAYTMESEATDTLNLEVDDGETLYVEHTIGMGIMMGRPHLTPATQADFDRRTNLKLSTSKPTDKAPRAAK